jgi:hypothetical protein
MMAEELWVARWPKRERADVFQETAARSGLSSNIAVEKDYWVCWTLRALFGLPEARSMVFKGGTSLSKVYGLIHRFSEDIDISIHRSALGFTGEDDPANAATGKKAQALLARIGPACANLVANAILPALDQEYRSELTTGESWALVVSDTNDETLLFHYPPAFEASDYGVDEYIKPSVRIEFGARGDVSPQRDAGVISYCQLHFPDKLRDETASVRVLAAERTFWEKATILHAEAHRPPHHLASNALSRHYYDLAMLAESEVAVRALAQADLLQQVTMHKKLFFRSAWAHYDDAKPGTFKLIPPSELQRELRKDYERMRVMFFKEPPSFDTVLSTLTDLERRINQGP